MKVYVVLEQNSYTDYEYCGVFKTKEQAKKRIEEIIKEHPSAKDKLYIQEENLND